MICRVEKNRNYTVMSNQHLLDKTLSLKAKGLLSVVLSLPDGWDYSIAGLVAICKESTAAVHSALDELKEHGYLEIRKIYPDKTASGRIEYEYIFREMPEKIQPVENQDPEKQEAEKQGIENQGLEVQGVENPMQLNTNKSNTNKSNTNNIYIQTAIDYLNQRTGAHYRYDTPETRKKLTVLYKAGYTLDDVKRVIDKKIGDWNGTDFARYLRPSTLFGNKFESYLNAPDASRHEGSAGASTDRYPPTYDLAEIDAQLTAEFMQMMGGE